MNRFQKENKWKEAKDYGLHDRKGLFLILIGNKWKDKSDAKMLYVCIGFIHYA